MRESEAAFARFRPLAPGSQPAYATPSYRSTALRAPLQPLVLSAAGVTEASGPCFSPAHFSALADLTRVDGGEAQGQRIIVAGSVSDEDGRPVAETMIELWQANAAGRYRHPTDQHDAPIDPHFRGVGRIFTDAQGRYRFVSVRPGSYPWRNHDNAWRPSHIHFSLFGTGFVQRLITQMYFEGDPLLASDPIFHSVPDRAARARLVARFDSTLTEPEWAHGYRFDIVLRGRDASPMEE
ncbi:MAG TPA: protocatechuate 3,4-dioxygenase subunit beta [Acetobacteraceae bacterium]|nr:protocatechuate 3,4-dioxygenase subunit beta [Acetobacteraceae bacterium]